MVYLRLLRWFGRLRWLRRGIRERVIRFAVKVGGDYDHQFNVDLFGYSYAGSLKNLLDWNIYFYETYEQEILDLIKHLAACGPGQVFLDVGANLGHHSLFASRHFSKVLAFEPYPPVRARLLDVVKQNSIGNIAVHGAGLGSATAEVSFFAPPDTNLGSGSFRPQYSELNTPYALLQVVVGDEYLKDKINAVDVIKIDVEGYESEVLKGLRLTLERYRPGVILELSDSTVKQMGSSSGLLDLFPDGYRTFYIQSRELRGWLFERPGLRLSALDSLREGNALVIPTERLPALRAAGLETS